ncbi:MAG TPA: flagellar motor switch protein FliM [Ilumatobacter sp.]|nr:flagellar motor switch protein FliM [Ilumatobacter sp.]
MAVAASPIPRVPARRDARRRGEPRPFDFRRPTTLSREHVRTMQIVQETLARGFTTTFASALRAVTNVSIRDIEQRPYDEYVRVLPNPGVHTLLSLRPLSGTAMLQIPLPVAFAMTELLLGGSGRADQPRRGLTDLEQALVRGIVEQTLPEIRYSFEQIVMLEPAIAGVEANPQFAQLAAPTDMVIIASFDVKIEAVTDVMTLCIPFSSLQPHLEALSVNANARDQSPDKAARQRAQLQDHVNGSPVQASAVFRPLVAATSTLVGLEVGDVILLHHPVDHPLTLEVGGVPTYDVTIGRLNRYLALQVGDTAPQQTRTPSRLRVVKHP